ncbi:hypothetical protein E7T06_04985 [Deinococcus sp. Arct2-2]|uniref:hypothetical protein n=1 Tax=Deinococcus sp. Arct2-2 TaxID=2568653 RepID=UPI0010A394A5|nr:hypothetical protein [Deinococcus sp. Arct2-2]THF70917.1 hypothetical protein E7T06_04985 [Deinococcus sp. Arct2-2]
MNASEDADIRTPYYGEWVWGMAFPDGSVSVGRMSIARRVSPLAGMTNASAGAAVWCVSKDECPYEREIGLIGTKTTTGKSELFAGMYPDQAYQWARFIGLDADGLVGTEINGQPTLVGTGSWQYYMGSPSTTVGFAMTQRSTNPPVKAVSVGPSPALTSKPEISGANLRALAPSELRERAIAAVNKAF